MHLAVPGDVEIKSGAAVVSRTVEAVEKEKMVRSMSTEAKVRIPDLFKGGLARSTITVCALWFCVNYVVYGVALWLPILLMKELHYAMAKGFIFLAVANLIGMTGQFSAGLNMDYLGRRPTVVYSVILLGLVPYFLFWLGTTPGMGMTFLIVLYIFNSSSFASMYAYAPESFPTRVRATGTGFASAIGRGGGMLGPTILGIVYTKAGLIWALNINMAVLVCAAVVVLAVGRETKGKTLEQISVEQMELRRACEAPATVNNR